jgi:hypothetical protein
MQTKDGTRKPCADSECRENRVLRAQALPGCLRPLFAEATQQHGHPSRGGRFTEAPATVDMDQRRPKGERFQRLTSRASVWSFTPGPSFRAIGNRWSLNAARRRCSMSISPSPSVVAPTSRKGNKAAQAGKAIQDTKTGVMKAKSQAVAGADWKTAPADSTEVK